MIEINGAALKDGLLCLEVPIYQAVAWLESYKPGTYDIEPHKEKRSLTANAYCWKLCELIAEKLRRTKDEVYIDHIKETGIFRDFDPLPESQAKTLMCAWQRLGTGWPAEVVDWDPTGSKVIVRCYYGSSQYDEKQMSRLIDGLVQDARSMGIKTESDERIESLLTEWGTYEKRT